MKPGNIYFKFTVPPTWSMSSYEGTCGGSTRQSFRKDALWHYNRSRAKSSLPPLSRMPAGTVYTRK